MTSTNNNTSTVSKISGINSQIIEMDFAKSGEDTTAMTSTHTPMSVTSLTLQTLMTRAFGDEILQLEDIQIKAFTDEEVRLLRANNPRARRARSEYRVETLEARTQEVNHYPQIELIKEELKAKGKRHNSLKLSISVSKAKAGALTHILNGKEEEATECLIRLKLKYGIMMEQTLEGSVGNLLIVDVEHPDQRTSRDYCGMDKESENARQLGKNIMNTINYIENMIKILC